jgi:hypothetical protein
MVAALDTFLDAGAKVQERELACRGHGTII